MMKKLLLTLVLVFGLSLPAMSQTLSVDGYIAIPESKVQTVTIKHWKNNPFFHGTDVGINFIGVGLYNADWDKYINQMVLGNPGSTTTLPVIILGNQVLSFYYKGIKAGSLKSNNGGLDRLLFSVNYPDGNANGDSLIASLTQEFTNSGFTKSGGNYLFYEVVYFSKK